MQKITVNQFKNELLKEGGTALRQLYRSTGVNIQKIKTVYKFDGAFTINKIKKEVNLKDNEGFLIISYGFLNQWKREQEEKSFYIYNSSGCGVSKIKSINYNKDIFDFFWCKSDYEEFRKKIDKSNYIIIVNKEDFNIIKEEKYKIDVLENQRIKIKTISFWHNSKGEKIGISRIDIIERNNGTTKQLNNKYDYNNNLDINNIIDKSGYNRSLYIYNLKMRLNEYKKLKAEERYKRINLDEVIEELEEIKAGIINKIKNIVNNDIIEVSYKVLSNLNDKIIDYKWLIYDIDNLIENINNNKINDDFILLKRRLKIKNNKMYETLFN